MLLNSLMVPALGSRVSSLPMIELPPVLLVKMHTLDIIKRLSLHNLLLLCIKSSLNFVHYSVHPRHYYVDLLRTAAAIYN